MKRVLTALALAALAAGAQAQVTFSGGSPQASILNYNPNGPAAGLAPTGGQINSLLMSSGGTLTATFLGFEAIDLDRFTFAMAGGMLSNLTSTPGVSSISGPVAAGNLSFTFTDTITGTTVGNGGNMGPFTSYAVLGTFNGMAFTPSTLGAYDLIIGFNDGLTVDADYDDMVIGLRVTNPVPEPETYALMLAGLGALGFISRRRRKTIDA